MDLYKEMDMDMNTDSYMDTRFFSGLPKLDLFQFCFGLFRETKQNFSVCLDVSELFWNKPKQKIGVSKRTETED